MIFEKSLTVLLQVFMTTVVRLIGVDNSAVLAATKWEVVLADLFEGALSYVTVEC